jgi:hypothetical protein
LAELEVFAKTGKLAAILSLLPFSRVKVEFMLKSSVFGEYACIFGHQFRYNSF